MKKTIFIVAAASVMFASCSNEDSLELNKGRAIEFRSEISRATGYTNANIGEFSAYAFVSSDAYFSNVLFSKQGTESSATYSSETKYYWPGDGKTVNFTAVAPKTEDLSGTLTVESGKVTLSGFTVNSTIAQQQDFIVGYGSGSKENQTSGVQLTFGHKLSKIDIKAKSGNATYAFKITGVKIVNVKNSGNYDSSNSTSVWGTLTGNATYTETLTNALTLGSGAESLLSGPAILMPQALTAWEPDLNRAEGSTNTNTGAYIAVKLEITAADGKIQIFPFTKEVTGEDGTKKTVTSEWAAVPISTTWKPGYSYTYVLDFTKGAGNVDPDGPVDPEKPIFRDPITFTVSETPWTDDDSATDLNKELN